jgi:hypothetical protein
MPTTCTPSELIALNPCFSCLSTKELWAVLLDVLLYEYNAEKQTTLTLKQVLSDSACWTCTSKKQRLQAFVSLAAESSEGLDAATVKADLKCLECASETQIQAALLSLFCKYWPSPD